MSGSIDSPREDALPVTAPEVPYRAPNPDNRVPILSSDSGSARADQDSVLLLLRAALADRYRIDDRIGHGGMAIVFRACRVGTDDAVAIKVMRPELGYEDGVVERFRIEGEAMARLHHENIVEVREHGESGSILWMELPLIDGHPLDQVIRSGPLDWRRSARLLGQAASALAYAHASGVIHRDIKPANLLIATGSDRLMIADFGIAKIIGTSRLTVTGTIVGTPAYMSPEQYACDRELTAATDQYSLGLVACQMITGIAPPAVSRRRRLGGARNQRRQLRSVAPDCPPALANLIERMLAAEPQDRWPDLEIVSRAAIEIAATGDAAAVRALGFRARISAALRRLLR